MYATVNQSCEAGTPDLLYESVVSPGHTTTSLVTAWVSRPKFLVNSCHAYPNWDENTRLQEMPDAWPDKTPLRSQTLDTSAGWVEHRFDFLSFLFSPWSILTRPHSPLLLPYDLNDKEEQVLMIL